MLSEDTILLLYEITDVIIAGLSTGSVYALMAVGMTPGLRCDQSV